MYAISETLYPDESGLTSGLLSVVGARDFLSADSDEVIKTALQQIPFDDYVAQWMHVFGWQ